MRAHDGARRGAGCAGSAGSDRDQPRLHGRGRTVDGAGPPVRWRVAYVRRIGPQMMARSSARLKRITRRSVFEWRDAEVRAYVLELDVDQREMVDGGEVASALRAA